LSRLHDLLRELRTREPALARDLEREVEALAERRAFGLNFERHVPEAVELPGRNVRKGDKVRILPPRGQASKKADEKLWQVVNIDRSAGTATVKSLMVPGAESVDATYEDLKTRIAAVGDLVVVAEFRDPIYPGLISTGKVERGGDKPYHIVINAENFHALQTLLFTHRGKVDCIYIDPPYNTGAKDWKYNNDYVESDDLYRHSKWLAMMERRLILARELLNPADSVLIVTIDEKEYLRLGLLLEQTFSEATIEMVTTVVNPRGRHRPGRFARTEEYIFFVMFGRSAVGQEVDPEYGGGSPVPWRTLRRSDATSARGTAKGGPAQFYPIYVTEAGIIEAIGEPLPHGVSRDTAPTRAGCTAVFPIRDSGQEMNWGLVAPALRSLHDKGYLRVGRHTADKPQQWEISYLTSGKIEDIESGRAVVVRKEADGSVVAEYVTDKLKTPPSTWIRPSHNAETGGTLILGQLIPGRRFPFPKSLYAVEDALRFFIAGKPDAVVLDFFAGSGTTAHAVMRLNRRDRGERHCISVTNNEVAADEQKALREKAMRTGDAEWERWGICEFITKPRLKAAITGSSSNGEPIKGEYKGNDEFPMADGFEENAEFFILSYEAPLRVASNREFARIAPLLWIRAGSRGRRIDDISGGWDVADVYGVLRNLDHAHDFVKAVAAREAVTTAYIITDEERLFESVAQELPSHVEPVRLYESYLRNFEIESGRGAL
jgi:adenine-specific DNA-methyltransferase